jgi:hypothetical protein
MDDGDEPVLPEEVLTLEYLSSAQSRANGTNGSWSSSSLTPPTTNNGGDGGPTSRISETQLWRHRAFLSILGACLPLLGLNYFLLYFLLWEVGMVGLSRGIPYPPTQPNLILTLVMVMGLKEEDARRLKLLLRVSKWLSVDLTFFFISVLVPQLGLRLLGLIQV